MAVTSVVASDYNEMGIEATKRLDAFFGSDEWELRDVQIEHVFWADPPIWRGTFTAELQ